jgi:site-specific recombinase XerD
MMGTGLDKKTNLKSLRHSFPTVLIEHDVAMEIVRDLIAHSNYSTTMDIYSHVDPDMHKDASKQINEALVN